jgi:hypothetical protein
MEVAMTRVERLKKHLSGKDQVVVKAPDYGLSSGSTMLNLACTGKLDVCFLPGHYYFFVGDSDSGKTWLTMTSFAEASINPRFDKYRFIYDAPEGGALMDIERYFGKRVARRLEPPERDKQGNPVHSETTQDFYFHVDDALKKGPCIYVLDSQDALTSREEKAKFDEMKVAARKGKKVAGSYGDSKARLNSANLRRLLGPLAKTGSILIVINQTRSSFSLFDPKTFSGGHALKFYATLQLWSSQKGLIRRNVLGQPRQLGIYAKVQVKKNRVTGRNRTVVIGLYHSAGIDDTGSMVQYLVKEGYWKSDDGKVTVKGLGPKFVGTEEKVVQWIESHNLESDLKDLVLDCWETTERACMVKRKNRYTDLSQPGD